MYTCTIYQRINRFLLYCTELEWNEIYTTAMNNNDASLGGNERVESLDISIALLKEHAVCNLLKQR